MAPICLAKRKAIVSPLAVLIHSLSLFLILGCQGNMTVEKNQTLGFNSEDPGLTGAAKLFQDPYTGTSELIPYTGAGNREIIKQLRDQVEGQTFNPELSRQITQARVVVDKTPQGKPEKLNVEVGIKRPQGGPSTAVKFEVPLKELKDGKLRSTNVAMKAPTPDESSSDHRQFVADATCSDADCDSVQLILKETTTSSPSSEAKGKSETLSQTAILYSRTQSQVRVRGPEKPVPAFAPLAQEAETQAPIAAQVETVEVLEGPSYIRVAVPGKAPSDQDRLLVEADLLRTTDASSPLNRATLNGRGVVGSLIGNSEDGEIAISIANPDPSADRASEPKENGEGENAKDSVSPQQNPTKVLEGDDQRVEQLTLFVVKPDSHSSSPTTSVTDSETTVAVSTPVQPKQPTHERGIENSKDSATPSSTGKSPQAKPTVKAKPSPKNQSSSQRNRKSPQTKSLNPSPKAKPATQAKTPPKSSSQPPSKPKKDVKVELVADSAPPPASTAPSTSFPIAYRGLRSPPPPHSPELPIEVESLGLAHIWSSQPQAIIPVDFSDSKLSEAQKMTRQMESLRNDPLIIRYMSYWSGQAKYQQCSRGKSYNMKPRALSFLHKIKALVPHALPIFQALDTTPETMYISALESQYAVTDGWKIETARCPSGRNCSTAAGPYQITETAAKHLRSFPGPGLNFITYALGPNRQVRADDDRSLFLPTTFAFATYAKMLINWFPHHPELWPLGYTEGMGALAKAMKCSLEPTQAARTACIRSSGAGKAFKNRERYRQASLGEIVKFKMAPCDKLDYVLMYLALKFVGSNPIKFGLQIDSAKIPKNLPPLYRPGQNRENLVKTMRKKSQ